MPKLKEFLVDLISAAVKIFRTNRDALAKDLREIADGIASGDLIADASFEKAKSTLDATDKAYDDLPPG